MVAAAVIVGGLVIGGLAVMVLGTGFLFALSG
jgi:hypothetical protein